MSRARVGVHVRLREELVDRLDTESDDRDVSRNWLIERLLVEGLDRLTPVEELRLTRPRS